MKTVLQFIFGALTLAGQVLLLETSDWGIHYLNAHPTLIKWAPLGLGVVMSFFFTMTISPVSNALKPPIVKVPGASTGTVNPFWGWFAMAVLINVVVNMLLE